MAVWRCWLVVSFMASTVAQDTSMDALSKVLKLHQELASHTPIQRAYRVPPSDSRDVLETINLGESGAAESNPTLNPAHVHMPAQRAGTAVRQLIHLHAMIAKLSPAVGSVGDLGESNKPSRLQELMDPNNAAANPTQDVLDFLSKQPPVTPRELSDLKRFYLKSTARVLAKLHATSVSGGVAAEDQLESLRENKLSFEGLSVGVEEGLDKRKSGEERLEACLRETARLCSFLNDLKFIREHGLHHGTEPARQEQAEQARERLVQSEAEVDDGIRELVRQVQSGEVSHHGEEGCELPKQVGPCKALIPRWWYNQETNQCHQFSWGGCRPNANNFKDQEACEQRCLRSSPPASALAQNQLQLQIPMEGLDAHVKQGILHQLDEALELARAGYSDSPALDELLGLITTQIYHSTLSYAEWADSAPLNREERAVASGDPDRLSKSGPQNMQQAEIVERFLNGAARHDIKPRKVPEKVVRFMERGIRLKDGSTIRIRVGGAAPDARSSHKKKSFQPPGSAGVAQVPPIRAMSGPTFAY